MSKSMNGKQVIPTKIENPHLYCVIDDCQTLHSVQCSKCDGEFCVEHYRQGHRLTDTGVICDYE